MVGVVSIVSTLCPPLIPYEPGRMGGEPGGRRGGRMASGVPLRLLNDVSREGGGETHGMAVDLSTWKLAEGSPCVSMGYQRSINGVSTGERDSNGRPAQ